MVSVTPPEGDSGNKGGDDDAGGSTSLFAPSATPQQERPRPREETRSSNINKTTSDSDAGAASTSSSAIFSSAYPQTVNDDTHDVNVAATKSSAATASSTLRAGLGGGSNGNKRQTVRRNSGSSQSISVSSRGSLARKKRKIIATIISFIPTSRMVWFQILIIVVISIGLSTWLHHYLKNEQENDLRNEFHISSNAVLDQFRNTLERKLNAIDTFATSITHTALTTNQTFPFVTIPYFSIRGSTARVLADALMIHWLPLVSDKNRRNWEEYALQHRYEVGDVEYEQDATFRNYQDIEFGLINDGGRNRRARHLEEENEREDEVIDPNVLQDGTGYHLRIYEVTTDDVYVNGTGPFLPIWQRTPMNANIQGTLNVDFGRAPALAGILPKLLEDPTKVILNRVIYPIPNGRANFNANLKIGQYRNNVELLKEDPVSFMAYPVYDTFNPLTKKLVGVLSVSLYWKHYFTAATRSNLVFTTKASLSMMICVLENKPFNQTFAYEIKDDGSATYLGEGDPNIETHEYYSKSNSHNLKIVSENINSYIQQQAGPDTRGYTTVPIHETYGQYTLRIYPSLELERHFLTNEPLIYSLIVGWCFFILSSLIIFTLSRAVANEANAKTEEQLSAYLAHELRNPLSAIDSALQAMNGANGGGIGGASSRSSMKSKDSAGGPSSQVGGDNDDDELKNRNESLMAIKLCTSFMSQLMNNILDARQLEEGNMVLDPRPMSLSALLLEVHQMLAPTVRPGVQWIQQCHTKGDLRNDGIGGDTSSQDWVRCDKHRYQQVITNVVTNAIKYTTSGSITISIVRETVGDTTTSAAKSTSAVVAVDPESVTQSKVDSCGRHNVVFTCVDTGPGIPKNIQERMFHRRMIRKNKGGSSSSGSAPASSTPAPSSRSWGLAITKLLVDMMGGTIRLESDPSVRPGTTCIISVPFEAYERPVRLSAASVVAAATTNKQQPAKSQVDRQQNEQPKQREGGKLNQPRPSLVSRAGSSYLPVLEELEILMVDDIKMNRTMLKRRLQKCVTVNAVITEAATGEEAIDIVTSRSKDDSKRLFDVIIMDQFMEGAGGVMLGSETVKLMREKHSIDCLIIGCSANDVEGQFEEAGADLFWGKPTPKNAIMVEQIRNGILARRK